MIPSTSRCRTAVLATILAAGFMVLPLAAQQDRTISGRVTAADTGEPLGSVQVSVRGTTVGTIAGENGEYSVTVPAGDVTLVFRLIGYKTAEVPVPAGQSTADVALEIDVLQIDELVVTGRATSVARRNLANAVATVQGEQLVRVPPQTLEQALYGKVVGANVQANSGAPGGGLQIDLRGVTTAIGEHKPLYVVDGVIVNNETFPSGVFILTGSSSNPESGGQQDNAPNRIADINPNDIESIEILKGAAAAAQYGSKASNGVVIITTRRGETGRPSYRIGASFGVPDLSEKIGLREYQTREDAAAAFGEETAARWAPGKFIDHEEVLAGRNPLMYEVRGSGSGALGTTDYYASGLAKNQPGVVIGTGYQKQSARLNLTQHIGDRLTIDLSTNGIHAETKRGFTNNSNDVVTSYWMSLPFTPSFVDLRQESDGTWPVNPNTTSNAIETASEADNTEDVWRFIGALNADWEVARSRSHSFRLLGRAGLDFLNQNNVIFAAPDLTFEPLDGLPGTSIRGDVQSQNVNLEANAVHEFVPRGGRLELTSSAGVQYESFDSDFARVTSQNLIAGQSNVDKGTVIGVLQQRQRIEDLGFYLQEQLLIDGRLLVSAGVRADQSSANTDDSELFVYPKAAASYVFRDLIEGTLDELKLRVAYGESGNRPLFGQKFTELQGQNIEGLATLEVEGQTAGELKPERQREIEGGVDMILFDERATVELTYYQKNVSDLLIRRELPPSTGFGTAVLNGGEARVRGVEAAVNLLPVTRENLRWNLRTNFSLNRSEVTELPVAPFQVQGFGFLFGTFVMAEGESLTSMWGNVTLDDGTVTTAPIGNSNPDFRIGFATDLDYKNWRFHTVWDWQAGSDVFNLTQLLFDLGSNSADCNTMVSADESVCDERLRLWPTNTEVYLERATFLKAREIGISFDFPESLRRRLLGSSARSLSISLTGRDLLTFTPYSGLDPEVSNFGSQAIGRNLDVGPYPPSRSFWLALNLGF